MLTDSQTDQDRPQLSRSSRHGAVTIPQRESRYMLGETGWISTSGTFDAADMTPVNVSKIREL